MASDGQPPALDPADGAHPETSPRVGARFGRYTILGELARGGMGMVYRARQEGLDRIVALKLLQHGRFASDEFVRRFRIEAQAAARLRHPHIVAIHEVGEQDGWQYFSMDCLEGGHLGSWIRDHPLTARGKAGLVRKIADAVHDAHTQGVLHRDLKPSNVLMDLEGEPHLTDFGLAKLFTSEHAPGPSDSPTARFQPHELTVSGQVLGTPGYSSPEQIRGRPGDLTPASDVYSLGAILYFLLTGRPPILGSDLEETLDRVLHHEPVNPRLIDPSLPRDLATICLKCLEKEGNRRYRSAAALAEDLRRFLSDEPIVARPVGRVERLHRWIRRKPGLAASLAALCIAVAMGVTGVLWQWDRAERHAREALERAHEERVMRLRVEEARTLLELQRAKDLLEQNETVRGVALLARLVRREPGNPIAATRLVSVLSQRDFPLPVGLPLQHDRKVNHAEFSPDGRWLVTASLDRSVRRWDAHSGEPSGAILWHSNEVRYAHYSPDGRRLAVVSDATAAALWDATTDQRVGGPLQHEAVVRIARFSRDGLRIATGSTDGIVRFWDAANGQPVLPTLRHREEVRGLHFSPDGRWLVSWTSESSAWLWDLTEPQPVAVALLHSAGVNSASFSPDGLTVLTACSDATAQVWDLATRQLRGAPIRHRQEVLSAEFSPDGVWVATTSADGFLGVWDSRSGAARFPPVRQGGVVRFATFSPDGQRLLVGFSGNAARVFNAVTGRPMDAPMQHDGLVWSARFSPDGQFVATASADRTARLWDIRPGRSVPLRLPHAGRVHALAWGPDGSTILTAADSGGWLWDTRTGRVLHSALPHREPAVAAHISPDGGRLATASVDGTARFWSPTDGRALTKGMPHDGTSPSIEFSPDSRWFLTIAMGRSLRIWRTDDGTMAAEVAQGTHLGNWARFSPDSRWVAFGFNDEDTGCIAEVPLGRRVTWLRGHSGFLSNAGFDARGQRLITCSEDGSARIWDVATGRALAPPMIHQAFVNEAWFSPDGARVVTASADATARVWSAANGLPLTEPLHHRAIVHTARFSPDGTRIVTSSMDGTAQLWDAESGQPIGDPFLHRDSTRTALFSPDGRWTATASYDGTAQVWELPPAPVPKTAAVSLAPGAPLGPDGDWLADLAEAVIGRRLIEKGALEPVIPTRLLELRRELKASPPQDEWRHWLEWFLDDRSHRRLSPGTDLTVLEHVQRCLESPSLEAARAAALILPTDPAVLTNLAARLRQAPGGPSKAELREADFLDSRAAALRRPENAR